MQQKLTKLKGKIDKSTTRVGYFNSTRSVVVRKKSRHKIQGNRIANVIKQLDLTDIYKHYTQQ